MQGNDAAGLVALLHGFSCADFRAAGQLLAGKVLPEVADDGAFWQLFAKVVPINAKAYLGTFLKAAVMRIEKGGGILLDGKAMEAFAAQASAIDRRKVLLSLFPRVHGLEVATRLWVLFAPVEARERLALLLRVPTLLGAYFLFREVRPFEGSPDVLRGTCVQLMKRGDSLAFSLASVLQAYYSLPPLPGTFSLSLKPYELSRLDGSFDTFRTVFK